VNEEELVSLLARIAELEAERPCSLARLAKQSGRAMSTLLRELSVLEAAGLVQRDGDNVRIVPPAA